MAQCWIFKDRVEALLLSMNYAEPAQSLCPHAVVVCLNSYDLIRKYRCNDCGEVMMCACDEAFGRRFLPHQLMETSELRTRRCVPVTLGFQPKVCAECRGLPAELAPLAEAYGRTSKIKRYYWREIFFAETERKAAWDEANPNATSDERRVSYDGIEAEVLADIKAQHVASSKYDFAEPSQAEILVRYSVEVVSIKADYVDAPKKGALIQDGSSVISPESFVTRLMEADGWSIMPLESAPLHSLFGVMMWLLVQDSADPLCQMSGFGDRAIWAAGGPPRMIWTPLPQDFGCEGYAERRKYALNRHFDLMPADRGALLWLFDYWRSYSVDLRQYLWAHREADVDRARRLIEILEPAQILTALRYLIEGYWERYLGWPDLLAHRGEERLFIEVKSSADKLTQDQKRWIADNYHRLRLPFRLVKLHRTRNVGYERS